jgi:hypothetical protein
VVCYDKNRHNTGDCRAIAKVKQRTNGHAVTKAVPGKNIGFSFRRNPYVKEKIEHRLSIDINQTTSYGTQLLSWL